MRKFYKENKLDYDREQALLKIEQSKQSNNKDDKQSNNGKIQKMNVCDELIENEMNFPDEVMDNTEKTNN